MNKKARKTAENWSQITDNFIKKCKNIDLMKFRFSNEFDTIKFLEKTHMNKRIVEWLKRQYEERPAGVDIAAKPDYVVSTDHSEHKHFEEPYQPKFDLSEKYESSVGRFISTNEPIAEGTLILEENAYAFVPVNSGEELEQSFDHCEHCGEINSLATLCAECKRTSYCSETCRDFHRYIHRYECAGYQMNLWVQIGIAQLGFRTFITGFHESQQTFVKMETNLTPAQVLTNLIEVDDANFVYRDVLKLITNFDRMSTIDIFMYCITARMLVLYLENYTKFFSEISETCLKIMPNQEAWKKFAMALILKHLGHLVMNAHTTSGIELMPATWYGRDYCDAFGHISPRDFHLVTEVHLTFSAIFPKTSILNHSCNENARNFFNGLTLRMFAQCGIPKNAEIVNSYGPNYKKLPKDMRKTLLYERYHFQCKCEKCSTNDKTYELLSRQNCWNECCKSQIKLHNIDFEWWNRKVLEDLEFIAEVMPLFRCKKCDVMQKLNPKFVKKYFNQVERVKYESVELTDRVNCLEQSAYYYLDSVTSLAIGHELRLAMAESILNLDMFDLVAERDIVVPLALVAVDFCKNTMQRYGIYSLEYFKSMTYVFHILALIAPHRGAFKKMIEKSLDMEKFHKYIHILPNKIQAMYKHVLNQVCSISFDV